MIKPISTLIAWPVMSLASGAVRKTTARATSSGRPSRSTGDGGAAVKVAAPSPAPPVRLAISRGVSIAPGRMAFTVIPCPANSRATVSVSPRTANFEAQ